MSDDLVKRLRLINLSHVDAMTPVLDAADRIEALETALAIDDATVTLQQQEMIKNRNAIGRAIDFINADLPIEALSTLRAAYRESDT